MEPHAKEPSRVSHREEKRGDRFLDVLTDELAGLRIVVSRLGAELISVARRNSRGEWIGFVYRDDDLSAPPKGWANHATVMGYFLHRLKDGRSIYRGRMMEGGTHGFLRHKIWPLAGQSVGEGRLIYRMERPQFSETEYPLDVSLDLSYSLEGGGVRVGFQLENRERELTAHVGFGLHPGFAATSFESFRFEMPAGLYRRHFSPTNYLSGGTEEIRFAGGEMPFPREKLSGSYILEFVDVPSRSFRFADPQSGRFVALDLTGVPYLTLWSDGGAFFCVEPCWGLTDHEEQRAFEEKEGSQKIAPGGRLAASVVIWPRLMGAQASSLHAF